ncbi:hypothetical protein [Aquimarina aggregata]|uniref:hypothetical protein n=1 Tax=Aquimarina aggregata TaxID=1642818 RepID=UPI00249155F6|nr:hypothetical protein [Aquimarina aggregata]
MKRTAIIVVFLVSMSFIGIWIWYTHKYEMDTVIPIKVKDSSLTTKVLIASQGSSFKDSLVLGMLRHYQNEDIYFKVIDAYTFFTVDIDKWDAIVIINSWEYNRPPFNLRKFIKNHPDQLDKLIVVSTVGSSNIVLKDVDVISGESIITKAPKYTTILVERLNKIIK